MPEVTGFIQEDFQNTIEKKDDKLQLRVGAEGLTYPDTPFLLEVAIATTLTEVQITSVAKPGYVTVKADADNTGNLAIGPTGIDTSILPLAPGDSIVYSLNDLSALYINGVDVGDKVIVLGAYIN